MTDSPIPPPMHAPTGKQSGTGEAVNQDSLLSTSITIGMTSENLPHVGGVPRHVARPSAEPSVGINGSNPFIEKAPLGLILLGLLALYFQN